MSLKLYLIHCFSETCKLSLIKEYFNRKQQIFVKIAKCTFSTSLKYCIANVLLHFSEILSPMYEHNYTLMRSL